ncbi:MAG: hypothetical protein ACFFDN_03530 [Candidatus Hodarchaeota archaeon]
MKKVISVFIICVLFSLGCATSSKYLIKIDSVPPDALITRHETPDASFGNLRKVAGTTPVEKQFVFNKSNRFWLKFEKRGFKPKIVEVTPENKTFFVQLERIVDEDGEYIKEFSFPKINRILLAEPDIEIIQSGIRKEKTLDEKSKIAADKIKNGISDFFLDKYNFLTPNFTNDDKKNLKSIWRDVETAMVVTDPIRLKYLPKTPYLETSLSAAQELGSRYNSEVILFIKGKQNIQTFGMKYAITYVNFLQTAVSYAQGYNNAMSRGGGEFAYEIHIPEFAEGTILKALLIDSNTGEILWLNQGIWGKINFNNTDSVKELISELFYGFNE